MFGPALWHYGLSTPLIGVDRDSHARTVNDDFVLLDPGITEDG
jgi:hypothetical protein